jgi:oligopeptidase B
MNKASSKLVSGLLLLLACQQNPDRMTGNFKWPDTIKPPVAKKLAKEFIAHGDKRIDEYYWLNQRDDQEVIEYLKAENAYTDSMLADTRQLQEKLFNEMKSRIREKDASVPYKDNGYWYYSRFEEGKQYPLYCRKKESLDAAEEIMLDQNKLAEGFPYYSVGALAVSDNNQIVAYTKDTLSRRIYTVHFKNLVTGETYPDAIPNVEGQHLAWAADSRTVFYVVKDKVTLLGFQVWRHEIGTDIDQDVMMFEETDNRFYMAVGRSKSRKYISIHTELNELTSETLLLRADNPTGHFTSFQPRQEGLQYKIKHLDDKFYVLTDWEAPNFRLMETPEGNTKKENWKEVIGHRDNVYLNQMEVFKDYLVIGEMKDALNQLRVIGLQDKTDHYISFDEKVYTAGIGMNPAFNTTVLRFSYQSLTTPASVYDYNMETRQRELKKQTEVVGKFDKNDCQAERLWSTGRDGTKIPVSLVYKKGVKKDGSNPLLLYAYGSYGYSINPGFSSTILSLLDRGFIYAIAHVRGGLELGRRWYDQGKMLNKKNTFYDFIDCGEFLIKEGFTSQTQLYANGGSAGGLLMGAIVNLRPDLCNGVIAEVPFVDVITTMSDATIPLTTGEYKEWGNPENSSEYAYMKSYSPYDNVDRKEYPNMLVTTGLFDSQVQYFEPAKWVAKLRSLKTGDKVLLFKINMAFGHGGASGRFDYLKDKALNYAFLLKLEGIED